MQSYIDKSFQTIQFKEEIKEIKTAIELLLTEKDAQNQNTKKPRKLPMTQIILFS